jgi:acylphosphatase
VPADTVSRRVVVQGHVQGVFFRDSTHERALSLGVSGWVRNRPDGAVEAVFEGSPGDVDAMVDFCSQGPSSADVQDVDVSDQEPAGLDGFEVR